MYALGTPTRSADSSKLLNLRGGPMVESQPAACSPAGGSFITSPRTAGIRKTQLSWPATRCGNKGGANLVNGQRSLRIYGEDVPIRAEVAAMDGLSAHVDSEDLLKWLGCPDSPTNDVCHPWRARGLRRAAAAHQARTGVGRARA